MKNRSLLEKKFALGQKKEMEKLTKIQTYRELKQIGIKKNNKIYNVYMLSSHVCRGKTFAAEQKLRQPRNFFSNSRV